MKLGPMHPYREPPPHVGTCQVCGSPGVVLHPFQYPDPEWDEEWSYCAQGLVTGYRCALCRDLPEDPRKALCYLGNLILRELRELRK
jgi:hypothetical protein